MTTNRSHLLAILLAMISFAVSPLPHPDRPAAEWRVASLVQLDDDEEREIAIAIIEGERADDRPEDDGERDGEG